jgi:hypothetical protein
MKSVLIAIPHIGNLRAELCEYLLKLNGSKDIEYKILFSNLKPHDNNRNFIVETFQQSKMDYLLMIDSDVIPQGNILDMVNHDKDVVSAFIKTYKGTEIIPLAMNKVDGGYKVYATLERGLNKVDATGTGCMMIKKEVFDKLAKPYFQFQYDKEGRLTNGEDFNFCDKINDAGMEVWFDTKQTTIQFIKAPY